MKDITRREFLTKSALATAGTMLLPQFLKALEKPVYNEDNKILIVIQLSGGNDGLNTIVPYRNDLYYNLRPTIALPADKILKATDELGFNSALSKLRTLYDKGYVNIINNVGYPNPDRSHFRSMDIWQSASGSKEYLQTGWIGRYLDASCDGREHHAIEIDDTLSLALKGNDIKSMALKDPEKLYRATHQPLFKKIAQSQPDHTDPMTDYLYKTAAETVSSSEYIFNQYKTKHAAATYPDTDFGKRLKTIGSLINSGVDTRVYYAALSGFDTHVRQKAQQERLLTTYSDGIEALVSDLEAQGHFDRVMIMTFSEFGRRVSENASAGTDHGTANNVFIIGKNLKKAGVFNETPDLRALDAGDLIYSVDFRSIYATLLSNWMGADATKIVGDQFPLLNFV